VRDLTALPVQRGLLDQAAANGDRLLEAAAARQPVQVKDKSVYITEDLASRIVAGLDGSIACLSRLMDPVWSERPPVDPVPPLPPPQILHSARSAPFEHR
jgi:hypothetical protein